jgi:hypothetical protein
MDSIDYNFQDNFSSSIESIPDASHPQFIIEEAPYSQEQSKNPSVRFLSDKKVRPSNLKPSSRKHNSSFEISEGNKESEVEECIFDNFDTKALNFANLKESADGLIATEANLYGDGFDGSGTIREDFLGGSSRAMLDSKYILGRSFMSKNNPSFRAHRSPRKRPRGGRAGGGWDQSGSIKDSGGGKDSSWGWVDPKPNQSKPDVSQSKISQKPFTPEKKGEFLAIGDLKYDRNGRIVEVPLRPVEISQKNHPSSPSHRIPKISISPRPNPPKASTPPDPTKQTHQTTSTHKTSTTPTPNPPPYSKNPNAQWLNKTVTKNNKPWQQALDCKIFWSRLLQVFFFLIFGLEFAEPGIIWRIR